MKLREFIVLALLGLTLAAKSASDGSNQAPVAPDAHAEAQSTSSGSSANAGQPDTGSNTLSIAGWYVNVFSKYISSSS